MKEMSMHRGKPVVISGGVPVIPLTCGQVEEIGYDTYNAYLAIVTVSKDDILEKFDDEPESKELIKDLSNFETIFTICRLDVIFREKFIESLEIFTGKDASIYDGEELAFFYFGDIADSIFLSDGNYEEFIEVIKISNNLEVKSKKEPPKSANEAARKLREKMKAVMDKMKKKSDTISLIDTIEIVATHSKTINIHNVWDVTVYSLYRILSRMLIEDKYERDFAQAMQGADIKDMEHWFTKIKIKSEE